MKRKSMKVNATTALVVAALAGSFVNASANDSAPPYAENMHASAMAGNFEALGATDATPLTAAEGEAFDAERIRLRIRIAGIKIGTVLMGSRYRGPSFDGSLNCVPVPPHGVKCAVTK